MRLLDNHKDQQTWPDRDAGPFIIIGLIQSSDLTVVAPGLVAVEPEMKYYTYDNILCHDILFAQVQMTPLFN